MDRSFVNTNQAVTSGACPDRAFVVFMDSEYLLARQAIFDGIASKEAFSELVQPLCYSAYPEGPFPVFQHTDHRGADGVVRQRQLGKSRSVEVVQPTAIGKRPDSIAAVYEELFTITLGNRIGVNLPIFKTPDRISRAKPQGAVGLLYNGIYIAGSKDYFALTGPQTHHPLLGGSPERAWFCDRCMNGNNIGVAEPWIGDEVGATIPLFLMHDGSRYGSHPERPIIVFKETEHGAVREALEFSKGGEPTVAVATQPAGICTDPEVAILILQQGGNSVAIESIRSRRFKHGKPDAVEAGEALIGADP